jgi:hypothetical protein
MRGGSVGFELAVDEEQEERGQDDPGKLVPVEEWDAEKGRGGSGVEGGEAEASVGESEEQDDQRPVPAAVRVGRRGSHGSEDSRRLVSC